MKQTAGLAPVRAIRFFIQYVLLLNFLVLTSFALSANATDSDADVQHPEHQDPQKKQEEAIKSAQSVLADAGSKLSCIQKNMEEWGHASISGFVLVPDNSGFFDLAYNLPTSNYVAAVRTNMQGKASFLQQTQTTVQMTATGANAVPGLNVQGPQAALTQQQQTNALYQAQLDALNQQIRVAELQSILQQISNNPTSWQTNQFLFPSNSVITTNALTGPTNLVPVLPTLISNTVSQGGITNGFSPLGQLASQMPQNQLSEPTILKLAATAKETERVLNFMGHPVDLPNNRQAFFAVGQISLMPGWRTKQDYICEVSTHLVYCGLESEVKANLAALKNKTEAQTRLMNFVQKHKEEEAARMIYADSAKVRTELGGKTGNLSLVAAFPFMEAQDLDLQSSYRNQLNLLLNLAASYVQAGYSVNANVLVNYVKQVQKDLSTATAFPTVIPGVEDNMLTYRFDPEVTAMTDPAQTETKSGSLLLPSSTPVLVMVVCDKEDLKVWPKLAIDVETRWIPRRKRSFWNHVYTGIVHNRTMDKELDPATSLETAQKLDEVALDLECLTKIEQTNSASLMGWDELRRKLASYQTLGIGRSTWLTLPSLSPVVTSVSPTNINADFRGKIVLKGQHLHGAKVLLGGIPLKTTSTEDDRIEAELIGKMPPSVGTDDLEVSNKGGEAVFPQAMVVSSPTPMITSYGPTNLAADYKGDIMIGGSNLGPPGKKIKASIGQTPLSGVSISENEAVLTANSNLNPGTNDLFFRTQRGLVIIHQAFVVAKPKAPDAPVDCAGRPAMTFTAIYPTHGFVNAPTTFVVTGAGFDPKAVHDTLKAVIVGGQMLTNVDVVSDGLLQFQVPAWSNAVTNSPYPDSTHAADLVLVAGCTSLVEPGRVYFDLKGPSAPSNASTSSSGTNSLIDSQVNALKALQAVQSNSVPTLVGALRLEVGGTSTMSNSPGGLTSTVIIQNGQNTNSSSH